MNLLGRIAYFFENIIGWFASVWRWLAELLATNILLREIMRVLGFAIIAFVFWFLIRALIDRISG